MWDSVTLHFSGWDGKPWQREGGKGKWALDAAKSHLENNSSLKDSANSSLIVMFWQLKTIALWWDFTCRQWVWLHIWEWEWEFEFEITMVSVHRWEGWVIWQGLTLCHFYATSMPLLSHCYATSMPLFVGTRWHAASYHCRNLQEIARAQDCEGRWEAIRLYLKMCVHSRRWKFFLYLKMCTREDVNSYCILKCVLEKM